MVGRLAGLELSEEDSERETGREDSLVEKTEFLVNGSA